MTDSHVDAAEDGPARIEVVPSAFDHPDATRLLRAFRREQLGIYGFADPVDSGGDDYDPPRGVFMIVRCDMVSVGCGGYRWHDRATRTAEIKKTYLVPEWRSQGVGRLILTSLERHAMSAGARRLILETGVRNTAAVRLFTRAGFQPTGSYVGGRDPAINRAFIKPLNEAAPPAKRGAQSTIAG